MKGALVISQVSALKEERTAESPRGLAQRGFRGPTSKASDSVGLR